jgi:hypothetical protein
MKQKKHRIPLRHWILLSLVLLLGFIATGCSKPKETTAMTAEEQPLAYTARFTNPVPMQAQPSEKCIACHTKTHPIEKLASAPVAGAEAGG